MNDRARAVLDNAEEAIRQGNLDRAIELLSTDLDTGLAGRRLAVDISEKLVADFHKSLLDANWTKCTTAVQQLRQLCGETQQLQRLRSELMAEIAIWCQKQMAQNNLNAVDEAIAALKSAHLSSQELEALLATVQAIRSANRLSALGRFAEAELQLESLPKELISLEVRTAIAKIQSDHEQTKSLLADLNTAQSRDKWQEANDICEKILNLAIRHPLALHVRKQALLELKARGNKLPGTNLLGKEPGMAHAHETHAATHFFRNRETPKVSADPVSTSRILWVDGVGGFLLCEQPEVTIGQAIPGNAVDLPILGDLSRRAAAIRRSGESYLLQPFQSVSVNEQKIDRATVLRNGDKIKLGDRVELLFSKPNPLSATARLNLISNHRWHPSVDGALLMAESCVLGSGPTNHVLCPFWSGDVVLFKNRDQWMCRSSLPLEQNGKQTREPIILERGRRVQGADFSLAIE